MTVAARKLKIKQVGPKAWKFECSSEEYRLMDKFDSGVDFWEDGNEEGAEKIFRALIHAWPLHIDAHHHLALLLFGRGELMAALDIWGKAADIGLRSLPAEFIIGEDKLEWICLENRPFLRAYCGLGFALFEAGRIESAHLIYNHLLAMNPNDNQGARSLAIESGFAMDRPAEVLRICNKYKGDVLVDSLYGRPLALWQLGKKGLAEKALIKAIDLSPLVARELVKKKHRVPKNTFVAYITVGGADEAYEYWQRLGRYWKETEGALEFLSEVLARFQAKRPVKH
jgi:tetratricopeptide (TPR) repeat protein